MELIESFALGLDPKSIIIGAVFSAFVSLWLNLFIKQPKLLWSGSGGGGGRDFKYYNIRLMNKVGWFGINLPETRILGLRIHPHYRKGLFFDKHPARDCRAHLYLKNTGESVGQLWWEIDGSKMDDKVTIESGKQATLVLFFRRNDDDNYFIYQPVSREDRTPKTLDKSIQFIGNQEFILRINYSYSRKYEQLITITRNHNGLLYLKTKNTSGIFLT